MPEQDTQNLLPNLKKIREKDFPLFARTGRVYLDNGATTQEPRTVIEHIHQYRTGTLRGSNHSENSDEARTAQLGYEATREKLRVFFSAQNYFIAFTSGTTASSNTIAERFRFEKNDRLLITEMEHNSQVLTARTAAAAAGATVQYIPVTLPDGRLDLEALKHTTGQHTTGRVLLMLVHVSNVTGVINPVKKIKEILGDQAVIYLDMAQSAGHIPVNLDELNVDFAGVSAHKMYGPMGMGALFVKKESDSYLDNTVSGGSAVKLVLKDDVAYEDSPARFEPGTQNLEGIVEWGFALDYLAGIGMEAIEKHDHALGEYFLKELQNIADVEIYGPKTLEERVPVFAFNVGGSQTNYQEVAQALNAKGVSVRDGCFCAHLLLPRLLKIPEETLREKLELLKKGANIHDLGVEGAVRAALAFYNTPEDIDRATRAIRQVARDIIV